MAENAMEQVTQKQGIIKRMMQRNRTKAEHYLQDPAAMQNLLVNVQKKSKVAIDTNGPLDAFRGQLALLWRMLRSWQKGAYKNAPKGMLISAVAALVYFLAPIDALPDFILGTGFLDDAAVFAFVIRSISGDLKKYADWETVEEAKRIIAVDKERTLLTATSVDSEGADSSHAPEFGKDS
jgi:uncharacterized membrane protein YkvA (DUF1232 family)